MEQTGAHEELTCRVQRRKPITEGHRRHLGSANSGLATYITSSWISHPTGLSVLILGKEDRKWHLYAS